MDRFTGKKVIARGIQSGVYFGTLKKRNGQEVELENARNIWYWSGANSLMQVATDGIKNIKDSKISVTVDSIILIDICELLPCTDAAIKCIEGAEPWKK